VWSETTSFKGAPPGSAEPRGWGISVSRSGEIHLSVVTAAYDFTPLGRIIDVAGGHGGLLAAILASSPASTGVLFDLPQVIAAATGLTLDRRIADRRELVSGDMFTAVPPGGDAYILKRTLHDWDDDRAASIIRNCRDAMNQDGRILIVDMFVPPGNEPHPGKYYDLMMMVMLGGRERTGKEFATLLRRGRS
jgi:O-methyltransferase domain